MSSNNSYSIGGGFFSMLTILFIYLKLTNQIDWSWFWVLSPLIISVSIALFILLCVGIVMLIIWLVQRYG